MEKALDTIANLILGVIPWILSLFGHRDDVKAVQEKVVGMCGFLPTAASVAAMLSAGNPVVTGVVGVATAICQAVTAAQQQPGLALASFKNGFGTVNGVPIEGDFVGK